MNSRVVLCAIVVLVAALAWLWLGAWFAPSTPAVSASAAAPQNTPPLPSSAAESPATSTEPAPSQATDPSRYEIPNLDDPQIAQEVAYVRAMVAKQFGAREGQRYQVNNLSLEFASLAKQAMEGDLLAARTLFEDLERCSHAARTRQRLDNKIAYHHRDLAQAKNSNAPRRVMSEASIAGILDEYRHCAQVTDEQLASRARWGKQLAEVGDTMARLQYQDYAKPKDVWALDYNERYEQYKKQAWQYLEMELAVGNSAALAQMGTYYTGYAAGDRDSFKHYMYLYAFAQRPDLHPYHFAYKGMETASRYLTPEQIREAERQGLALYQQCCRH
jgi:hypothetical protein